MVREIQFMKFALFVEVCDHLRTKTKGECEKLVTDLYQYEKYPCIF